MKKKIPAIMFSVALMAQALTGQANIALPLEESYSQ